MAVMSDKWIKKMVKEKQMIKPFVEGQIRKEGISYGVSSYGYDARVSNNFKIFTNVDSAVVDPKNYSNQSFVDRKTDVCVIPPNSFALAGTVEYFKIPRNIMVICLGKSTYARCGIIVNVTPLEPEWEGHVTLEFSNTTPLPAKISANEGACQILFLKGIFFESLIDWILIVLFKITAAENTGPSKQPLPTSSTPAFLLFFFNLLYF